MKKKLQAEIERLRAELAQMQLDHNAQCENARVDMKQIDALTKLNKEQTEEIVRLTKANSELTKKEEDEYNARRLRNQERDQLMTTSVLHAYQACVDMRFADVSADASTRLQIIKTSIEEIANSSLMKREDSLSSSVLFASILAAGGFALAAYLSTRPSKETP